MCVYVCAWCAQNCCCPQLLHRLRPVRIDLTLLGLSTKLFERLVFFLRVRGCLSGFTGVSVVSVRRAAHSATVFFAHGSRGSGTTTAVSFFAAQKQRESILCCERCVCVCVRACVGVLVCTCVRIILLTCSLSSRFADSPASEQLVNARKYACALPPTGRSQDSSPLDQRPPAMSGFGRALSSQAAARRRTKP